MAEFYSKNYWRLGFRSRLYDLFTPVAYSLSLKRSWECIPAKKNLLCLDAGCGSGQLLSFLKNSAPDIRYLGVDALYEALSSGIRAARSLRMAGRCRFLRADLTEALPIRAESVDVTVAHFSIYSLGAREKRVQALKNLLDVAKPGAVLIVSNPTHGYNAKKIIANSLAEVKGQGQWLFYILCKFLIYPFTLRLGLCFIEKQIRTGRWHGYAPDELSKEAEAAGWMVVQSEPVYAGCGVLVLAKKQ